VQACWRNRGDEILTEKILIVDGLNTFLRNWMVVPSMNTNGEPVGGIVGFIRTLKKMIRENNPSRVVVVWDGVGGSQKRRGVYSEYKDGRKPRANRTYDFESPEASQRNLFWQGDKVKQIIGILGVNFIEIPAIEADDVIAYLARWMYDGAEKVIVSTDKDFLQLVDGKTSVYSASKDITWTPFNLKEKLNILPENFILMKCLMGDGSDNIDGVKGFGEKTVVKLFPFLSERPTSLNEIIDHASLNITKGTKYKSVVEDKEKLSMNYQLMQLSSPTMSAQASAHIRSSLDNSKRVLNLTEFKLLLIREGLSLEDKDLMSVFTQFGVRMRNAA